MSTVFISVSSGDLIVEISRVQLPCPVWKIPSQSRHNVSIFNTTQKDRSIPLPYHHPHFSIRPRIIHKHALGSFLRRYQLLHPVISNLGNDSGILTYELNYSKPPFLSYAD